MTELDMVTDVLWVLWCRLAGAPVLTSFLLSGDYPSSSIGLALLQIRAPELSCPLDSVVRSVEPLPGVGRLCPSTMSCSRPATHRHRKPTTYPHLSISLTPSHLASLNCSNRLVSACHQKCIQPDANKHRYAEGELLKGEAVCIDRCTGKFFEVNKKVGERLQQMGGQAQQAGTFGR